MKVETRILAVLSVPVMILLLQGTAKSVTVDKAKACGSGVADASVTPNPNSAVTGDYTKTPSVTKISDSDNSPDPDGLFYQVNPKVYGGRVNNHVIPDMTNTDETRGISVDYHDSGKDDLEYDLTLRFQEVDGQDYTITWDNHEFSAKWKGEIALPKEEANGSAKWRAWTFHPWDPAAEPGSSTSKQSQVAVLLKAIVPNVPVVTEWERSRNSNPSADGPGTTVIDEPGEMAVFADPQQNGEIQGLKTEFGYTGKRSGWVTVTTA